MAIVFGLPGGWRVARFGIRGNRGADSGAQSATDDGTLTATDFVAYGCAGRPAKAPTDRRIQGGIPRVSLGSDQQH
jgi:hypothetical protein